jgi:hypothetical protein
MRLPTKPFLVDNLERLFRWLNGRFSLFEPLLKWIRQRQSCDDEKLRTAATIELWVMFNGFLSVMFLVVISALLQQDSPKQTSFVPMLFVAAYPLLRIQEILVYQFWTQVLGGYPGKVQPRVEYNVVGTRRSIVLAGLLYVEVVLWFAGIYRVLPAGFSKPEILVTLPGALYYSAVTMTTTGYGEITPILALTQLLVCFQIATGFFMTVLIIARVVSYLPKPHSLDPAEHS